MIACPDDEPDDDEFLLDVRSEEGHGFAPLSDEDCFIELTSGEAGYEMTSADDSGIFLTFAPDDPAPLDHVERERLANERHRRETFGDADLDAESGFIFIGSD